MSTVLLSVSFLAEAFEADEPLDWPLFRDERRGLPPDISVGYERVYFTSRASHPMQSRGLSMSYLAFLCLGRSGDAQGVPLPPEGGPVHDPGLRGSP